MFAERQRGPPVVLRWPEVVVTSDDSAFAWTDAEKDLMGGVDTSIPHSARIWNYWLGGKDNFAVDRAAGDLYRETFPKIVDIARAARAFQARAVRYLADDEGIRQFLDIGTGLPTAENTHEVAQRVAPDCRIVYVDNDPLVLVHARALLTSTPPGVTDYLEADVRNPGEILSAAARTLDFTRPVAIMLMGIMGHVTDDAAVHSILHQLLDRVPAGSFLVLRDATNTDQVFADAQQGYNQTGAVPYKLRSPGQVGRFFDGLDLVEPGVVSPLEWRPEATPFGAPRRVDMACGVARKP
jgi:S-adenosyl methyltransferase